MVTSFASEEFYAACAQVLPVLFLVAAVEFRLIAPNETDVKTWTNADDKVVFGFDFVIHVLFIVGFVLSIAIGEFASLQALHQRAEGAATFELVVASLAACGVALICAPLMQMVGNVHAAQNTPIGLGYAALVLTPLAAVCAVPIYAAFVALF